MEPLEQTENILEIENYGVNFRTSEGSIKALQDVNLKLMDGEILGIIGESGSGKSTLALSLIGLLPENASTEGSIRYQGEEISYSMAASGNKEKKKVSMKQKRMLDQRLTEIRWKNISMVFQGAMNSFNPVYTIRRQISEVFHIHTSLREEEVNRKIEETSKIAGFNTKFLDSYPHELSGGMKQRAVIAMALALDPKIVIADEPTTGLDVITQAKIIKELKALREKGIIRSLVIISHDVGVVSQLADHVVVLYAGRVMEYGRPEVIFRNPSNPYSKALIESYPSIHSVKKTIYGIPGSVPDLLNPPNGCYFSNRCSLARDQCDKETPAQVQLEKDHTSLCHFAEEFSKIKEDGILSDEVDYVAESDKTELEKHPPLLKSVDLCKYFDLSKSVSGKLFSGSQKTVVHAVDKVSLDLPRKKIIAVVGESGSGKTTLGRTLILSGRPTSGQIMFAGDNSGGEELENVSRLMEKDKRFGNYRKRAQLIFQDPYDSLNPKMSIFDIVAEPIYVQKLTNDFGRIEEMVRDALETANLKPAVNYLNRYPHELSGGERQRVSIARSLILRPDFLVADEPISMLDVSIRANIMNLLLQLKSDFGMTIMYISHDIASARYVSDDIVVMYLGVVVEYGPSEEIIRNPSHPYTKALIQAVPTPDPAWLSGELHIVGEIGNAINPKQGCRFYDRCLFHRDICLEEEPPRRESNGRFYVCHFEEKDLTPENMTVLESPVEEGKTDN